MAGLPAYRCLHSPLQLLFLVLLPDGGFLLQCGLQLRLVVHLLALYLCHFYLGFLSLQKEEGTCR